MPFSDGLIHLMKDNSTEFGSTINALHRFNLYPEVILSSLFSIFRRFSDYFEWQNIGEATRAQWTPPLRESFGYPIFLLQTILTGYILRKGNINLICGFLHIFLTVAFCCFWQVFDLLKAKLFPNYANFHTLLYTCAPEFDFLQFETISKLISTWLLPLNCLVICFLFILFYRFELANGKWLWRSDVDKTRQFIDERFCPEIAYQFIQLCSFIILALLFMRLKLFATPHLCLLLSLLANKKIIKIGNIKIIKLIFIGIILSGMSNKGIKNIQNQLEMKGEYNNPEQESLFIWINENTLKNDVFGGTMALMANLKLSTLRPIVNHPHYENEEIR
uniref:Uncharacterized protein n=1 Tax=Meloidogyne hapla TaxID=6305 RepID=A0A1I8BU51_MELHA